MRHLRCRITLLATLPVLLGPAGACAHASRPAPVGGSSAAAAAPTAGDEIDVCLAALQHLVRSWPAPPELAVVAERPAVSDSGRARAA